MGSLALPDALFSSSEGILCVYSQRLPMACLIMTLLCTYSSVRVQLFVIQSIVASQGFVHGDSPGKNAEVGSHSLLQGIYPTQGIFPTQGSNPGLPHCKQILYCLSHQGSPRILEWIAYPFSRRSSQPGNQTGVSCLADGFFPSWATREA